MNPIDRAGRETVLVALAGAVLLAVHWHVWGRFLPDASGRMGGDYGYFMPLLLNGYYWFQANGPFAVPWFTPAFCGGLPLYPNPESLYYSLPQALTLVTNPVSAVRVTFVVFAGAGFAGTYVLLRRCFATGVAAALFGATVFLFNGAYGAHLAVGHLPWHSLALAPAIAALLLWQTPPRRARAWAGAIAAGFAFAYMFQSGGVHAIVPVALSVLAIGAVHAWIAGGARRFAGRFALAAGVAAALSAAKLASALAFLSASPRDGYPLPGFSSLADLVRAALGSLFLAPADESVRAAMVNAAWLLDRHEFEIGVTPVPALVIAAAVALALWRRRGRPVPVDRRRLALGAAALALLAVPVAVNLHTPEWHALLKSVPIVRNSSTLFRWFVAWIPVVAVLAGLAAHGFRAGRITGAQVALAGTVAVVAINLATDLGHYRDPPYDPRAMVDARRRAAATGAAPPIREITFFVGPGGALLMPTGRNDTLADGRSQLLCYAAIFGYRLEWLPWRNLQPGPVLAERDGRLNLFDPACFVFPRTNACRAGDRFRAGRAVDAAAFAAYRPHAFEVPPIQRAANALNVAALLALGAWLVFTLLRGLPASRSARGK